MNGEKFQKGGSHFQSKTYIADFDLPQGFKQGYWENFAIEVSENEGEGVKGLKLFSQIICFGNALHPFVTLTVGLSGSITLQTIR